MKFKGAIFDFNGTLIWDTDFHNRAFDIFFEKQDTFLTDIEKRQKIHGKPNVDIMRGIFGNHLSETAANKMGLEKEAIYRDLIINDLQFAPGAEDVLNFLKTNNTPMTIATSAGIENVSFYFEKMNLNRWFTLEKTAYDNGMFRGKPYPDIFIAAAEKLGLKPEETVMFEDSMAGIKATENAGAGKIYIVNSIDADYGQFSHEIITDFVQVDRNLFV